MTNSLYWTSRPGESCTHLIEFTVQGRPLVVAQSTRGPRRPGAQYRPCRTPPPKINIPSTERTTWFLLPVGEEKERRR